MPQRPNDLTRVPGLVGELVDWMEATSASPDRPLALAASLAFVGALAGRLYASEETNLRTNNLHARARADRLRQGARARLHQ